MKVVELKFSEARPEFANLSELEILASMHCNDSKISAEVTRLICCFWARVQDAGGASSVASQSVIKVSTCFPIERVAVKLMIQYLESEGQFQLIKTLH